MWAKDTVSNQTNLQAQKPRKNSYEHVNTQEILFPRSLTEESTREWSSDNPVTNGEATSQGLVLSIKYVQV